MTNIKRPGYATLAHQITDDHATGQFDIAADYISDAATVMDVLMKATDQGISTDEGLAHIADIISKLQIAEAAYHKAEILLNLQTDLPEPEPVTEPAPDDISDLIKARNLIESRITGYYANQIIKGAN